MKKDKSAALAEEAPRVEPVARPRFRLKLDHDGTYFGSEELPAGEELALGADDIVLDHAPDNAPGMYRWSREAGRLEPLPKAQQKAAAGAPTLEQAFYALTEGILASGSVDLGPVVNAWRKGFEKTIDMIGARK